jgi:cell division protein FtsZ
MIQFDLPKEQSSIIKVIGVGGGGSNAVNHMFSQNIEGVNFIICNTDAQAIALSSVPNKIQLGPHLTQGLGAGANPNIGRQATEESLDEIKRILEVNTKMAFITAGMGGGTGTGGAPIIAKICKDLGILTVGIVTTPFAYEGKKRIAQAQEGIDLLKQSVDTLLIISNDKLRHQFGNLKMKEAFGRADNVLATAAKCITDVINSTGQINVDFADVCTVMKDGGVAILGSASAAGENRAQIAIESALTSPLLNDNDIKGAKWILININSAEGDHEHTMDEIEIIQNYIISQAGDETDVILGLGFDNSLGSEISITLIATGFDRNDPFSTTDSNAKKVEDDRVVLQLEAPVQPVVSIPMTREIEKVIENQVEERILLPVEEKLNVELVEQVENKIEVNVVSKVEANEPNPIIQFTVTEKNTTPTETVAVQSEEKPTNEAPIFFEISSSVDQLPIVEFEFDEAAVKTELPKVEAKAEVTVEKIVEATQISTTIENTFTEQESLPVSGGYLAKPTQIYVVEEVKQQVQNPVNVIEEEIKSPINFQSSLESAETDFTVFEKQTAEVKNVAPITTVVAVNEMTNENSAIADESEDLRRRANERLAKLRNLSFNTGSTDPNSEYDTVPAYLRRNMEKQVQIADVETFYSHYTVKNNSENQIELNTINSFLDGKKPD